jgi:hypothetical protein
MHILPDVQSPVAFDTEKLRNAIAVADAPFKPAATTETRNTCTYCPVACGMIADGLVHESGPGHTRRFLERNQRVR